MTICEGDIATAYAWAVEHATVRARGRTDVEDELIDAATNAVMWAIRHCRAAETFTNFARAAVRRWVSRQESRIKRKRANRPKPADPAAEGTVEDMRARAAKPVRPLLIDDLPEDLALAVRFYMVDGYTLREIGLLTGVSPNTVDQRLKRAAAMLMDGPTIVPTRRNGEKRLSAG